MRRWVGCLRSPAHCVWPSQFPRVIDSRIYATSKLAKHENNKSHGPFVRGAGLALCALEYFLLTSLLFRAKAKAFGAHVTQGQAMALGMARLRRAQGSSKCPKRKPPMTPAASFPKDAKVECGDKPALEKAHLPVQKHPCSM